MVDSIFQGASGINYGPTLSLPNSPLTPQTQTQMPPLLTQGASGFNYGTGSNFNPNDLSSLASSSGISKYVLNLIYGATQPLNFYAQEKLPEVLAALGKQFGIDFSSMSGKSPTETANNVLQKISSDGPSALEEGAIYGAYSPLYDASQSYIPSISEGGSQPISEGGGGQTGLSTYPSQYLESAPSPYETSTDSGPPLVVGETPIGRTVPSVLTQRKQQEGGGGGGDNNGRVLVSGPTGNNSLEDAIKQTSSTNQAPLSFTPSSIGSGSFSVPSQPSALSTLPTSSYFPNQSSQPSGIPGQLPGIQGQPTDMSRATPQSALNSYYQTPGYQLLFGGDATQRYQQSPGYQYAVSEAMRQMQQNYASKGLLESGSALRGLQDRAQNMAMQDYDNWLNRQTQMYGDYQNRLAGLAGGSTGAEYAMNLGQNLGQTTSGMGAGLASLFANQGTGGLGAFTNTGAAQTNNLLQAAQMQAQVNAANQATNLSAAIASRNTGSF